MITVHVDWLDNDVNDFIMRLQSHACMEYTGIAPEKAPLDMTVPNLSAALQLIRQVNECGGLAWVYDEASTPTHDVVAVLPIGEMYLVESHTTLGDALRETPFDDPGVDYFVRYEDTSRGIVTWTSLRFQVGQVHNTTVHPYTFTRHLERMWEAIYA